MSGLGDHVGFWMRFVSNYVSQSFAKRLLETGVTTAEWVVLREMYDHEEMMPSVLAERLGLSRGAISKLVDRLIAKKLAVRREREDDRRFQSVLLTKAGRELVPGLAAIADRNDAETFGVLTAAERQVLKGLLKKLVHGHELRHIPME